MNKRDLLIPTETTTDGYHPHPDFWQLKLDFGTDEITNTKYRDNEVRGTGEDISGIDTRSLHAAKIAVEGYGVKPLFDVSNIGSIVVRFSGEDK